MSFLDFLSSGLTAGTQGAAGYLEGQAKGRKEQEARAMQAAALLRQKHIDEQNDIMDKARLSGLNSTNALNARRQSPEFAAKIKAALGGDQAALGEVLAADPSMASALTRPDPVSRKQVVDGQVVDVGAGTATPIAGFTPAATPDKTTTTRTVTVRPHAEKAHEWAPPVAGGPAPKPSAAQVLAWAKSNPKQTGETPEAYKARAKVAFGARP